MSLINAKLYQIELDHKAECQRIYVFKLWCWRRLFFAVVVVVHIPLFFFLFKFYFIFKLYNIVLGLQNIEMNPPQVYMCSPS